jgi:pantothenate synthetase
MFRLQYAEAVDPGTLRAPRRFHRRTLLAVAGFLGRTRLIDNVFAAAR